MLNIIIIIYILIHNYVKMEKERKKNLEKIKLLQEE